MPVLLNKLTVGECVGTAPSNALPPSLSYQLGTEAAADIAPESFWRLQMPLTEPKFLKCNVSVSEDGALGVFGRKNTPPTIVQYDFYEPLLGHTRSRRSAEVCFDLICMSVRMVIH